MLDQGFAIELVDVNGLLGSYLAHWHLPVVPQPGDEIGIEGRAKYRVLKIDWRQHQHAPGERYPFVTVIVHCREVK